MVCESVPVPLLRSTRFVGEFREHMRAAIPDIVECLKDSNHHDVRTAAMSGLSELGAHG
jgi:HEAT repeat protein